MGTQRVIALLDTNILIAAGTTSESRPDLSGFTQVVVSTLSWSELTMGLHATTELAEFKARMARLSALKASFGEGLPFDDACVTAYDRLLQRVVARGGSAKAHVLDRMIAATALAHDMTVVTRDLSGFAGLEGLVSVERR